MYSWVIRGFSTVGKTPLKSPQEVSHNHISMAYQLHKEAEAWQNQQNQQWLTAWAPAQSDLSFRCPHEVTLGP